MKKYVLALLLSFLSLVLISTTQAQPWQAGANPIMTSIPSDRVLIGINPNSPFNRNIADLLHLIYNPEPVGYPIMRFSKLRAAPGTSTYEGRIGVNILGPFSPDMSTIANPGDFVMSTPHMGQIPEQDNAQNQNLIISSRAANGKLILATQNGPTLDKGRIIIMPKGEVGIPFFYNVEPKPNVYLQIADRLAFAGGPGMYMNQNAWYDNTPGVNSHVRYKNGGGALVNMNTDFYGKDGDFSVQVFGYGAQNTPIPGPTDDPTRVFYINNAGNVSIGAGMTDPVVSVPPKWGLTPNPNQKLWVAGNSRVDGVLSVGTNGDAPSNAYKIYTIGDMAIEGNISMIGDDRRIFMGGGTGKTFGIALDATNDKSGIFYTRGTNVGEDFASISPNGGGSTSAVMNVFANGSVGIGITTPPNAQKYKLWVEGGAGITGTLRTTEVIVQNLPWPDYVFKKEYKLASLSEIEQHIAETGHLPGIPSEAEVKEKGVNLGQMQAKLLEKIEEMTLRMIEQEKTIQAMENKIHLLENKK